MHENAPQWALDLNEFMAGDLSTVQFKDLPPSVKDKYNKGGEQNEIDIAVGMAMILAKHDNYVPTEDEVQKVVPLFVVSLGIESAAVLVGIDVREPTPLAETIGDWRKTFHHA